MSFRRPVGKQAFRSFRESGFLASLISAVAVAVSCVLAGGAVAETGSTLPIVLVFAAVLAAAITQWPERFATDGLPLALLVPPTIVVSVGPPIPDMTTLRGLVFVLFIRALLSSRCALPRYVLPIVASFTIWVLVLAIASPSREAFREALGLTVGAFAPALLALAYIRTERQVHRVISSLIALGAMLGAAAIYESVTHRHFVGAMSGVFFYTEDRGGTLRAQVTFPQPIVLGTALAMIWPLTLSNWHRTRRKWVVALAGALIIAGLFCTLSRGPWIGAVLATFTYLGLCEGRSARPFIALAAVVAAVAMTPIASVVSQQLTEVVRPTDAKNRYVVEYRQALLRDTSRYVVRHPLGGDLNPYKRPRLLSSVSGNAVDLAVSIDNGYARYAIELGVVGVALLVVMMIGAVIHTVRRAWLAPKAQRSLFAGLASTQIALIFITATVATLTWEQIGVLFWFIVGIAFAADEVNDDESPDASHEPVIGVRRGI